MYVQRLMAYRLFTYRIWMLNERSIKSIVIPIIFITMRFGLGLALVIFAETAGNFSIYRDSHSAPFIITICSICVSLLDDLNITLTLVVSLYKRRSGVRAGDEILRLLMAYIVNTGLLPMLNAVAILFTFLFNKGSLLYGGLMLMQCNLYANSLLATLNARRGLNHRRWTLAEHDWTSIELGVSQQQAEHDPPRHIEIFQRTLKTTNDMTDIMVRSQPERPNSAIAVGLGQGQHSTSTVQLEGLSMQSRTAKLCMWMRVIMAYKPAGLRSLGRNAGPVSPALLKLEPEQRMRFVWSSHKVSQVLGATPVVDITSPSVSTSTPPTTPVSTRNLKHLPSFLAQHSPVTFIHPFTSKASARDDTIKSPVNIAEENTAQPVTATRRRSNKLRRRNAPTALYLGQAQRTEALPLSFRYGLLKTPHTASFTPLSPVSSLSPITEAQVERAKFEKLDKLDKLARCAGDGIPLEFLYPSLGQVGAEAEKITSFLDLYRMGAQDDGELFKTSPAKDEEATVIEDVTPTIPQRASRRVSRGLAMRRRRSRSVGDFYSFADALEMSSARADFKTENHYSGALHSPSYLVPPPTATSASVHPYANPFVSPCIIEDTQSRAAVDADTAERTVKPGLGLVRHKSLTHAKQSILRTDAKVMAAFRSGFPTRPLDLAPQPAPTGPLPSPPVLHDVRSPRVPYWVRSSFRPRDSVQALQYANATVDPYARARKDASAGRQPAVTPRTQRFERRMGWGGEWNQGSLADVIDTLKEL
ncbi:hypothetical protein AcV5_002970 [Taiwanofungus camphoratus]|nr:hypothetical protein AcV5_002970 [Antrodia cinnamomea]